MSAMSKRLEKIEQVLRPVEPEKVECRFCFVRGGHGAPIERTVKSWAIGENVDDLDDPATEWEVLHPADPNWPRAEGIVQ